MAMIPLQSDTERIMRVSLSWALAGASVVFLLGLAGGIVAQQLFPPPLPPLNTASDRLLPTVQQVTVSPNTVITDLVPRIERSIVSLARGTAADYTIVATGSVVTNDGLIVTTAERETAQLAIDAEGRPLTLEFLGRDALYGFSYYRAADAVLVPLDVRGDDAVVGQELLLMAREAATFAPRVRPFRIFEFTLPEAGDPAAVQRVMRGAHYDDSLLDGSPLLDEEGKIAGIITDAPAGQALSALHLKSSLLRMANNQREANPLANLGLAISYSFIRVQPTEGTTFVAEISAITPATSAALSSLEVGDAIVRINNEALTWQNSVVQQLAAPLPFSVTIIRDGTEQQVQLQPAALSNF